MKPKAVFFSAKTGKRSCKNEILSSRECIIRQNNMLKPSKYAKSHQAPAKNLLRPTERLTVPPRLPAIFLNHNIIKAYSRT